MSNYQGAVGAAAADLDRADGGDEHRDDGAADVVGDAGGRFARGGADGIFPFLLSHPALRIHNRK